MERKSFGTKLSSSSDKGIAEMIVAVFDNIDRGNDVIRFGAFANSLKRKLPKGVWGHKWEVPIAKTLEARELRAGDRSLPSELKGLGGLYIKAAFNLETQRGRESFSDLKFGIIDEFSIGFKTVKSAWDEEKEIRELLEVDLFEWSPVLAGMNPATQLISVKSARTIGKRAHSLSEIEANVRRLLDSRESTRFDQFCRRYADLLNPTVAEARELAEKLFGR